MKKHFLVILCSFSALLAYSQNQAKIQRIDSLKKRIDARNDLESVVRIDTIYLGFMEGHRKDGVFEKNKFIYSKKTGELVKVINFSAQNIYYYFSNELIKVESLRKKRKEFYQYYYNGDSCFYFQDKKGTKSKSDYYLAHSKSYSKEVKQFTFLFPAESHLRALCVVWSRYLSG